MGVPLKTKLYRELKLAVESGMEIPELSTKDYVYWKEPELEELHSKYLNPNHVEPPTDDEDADDLDTVLAFMPEEPPTDPESEVEESQDLWHREYEKAQANLAPGEAPQTFTDWISEVLSDPGIQATLTAQARQAEPIVQTPEPSPEVSVQDHKPPRETWAQIAPQELARLLGVPFSDRAADRAGLTFNTHGPDDPLRVDSRGMVWYKDEVPKPAIPKRRMRRKVKTLVGTPETVQTYRPDGGLDETFEVDGGDKHEIEIKISLPSSQVGIYVDPRMPFKIHQYNGRRAFDYNEVVKFYGGLMLVPSSIQTIYIDSDLCFEIGSVRDTIEREYRDKVLLGRNM